MRLSTYGLWTQLCGFIMFCFASFCFVFALEASVLTHWELTHGKTNFHATMQAARSLQNVIKNAELNNNIFPYKMAMLFNWHKVKWPLTAAKWSGVTQPKPFLWFLFQYCDFFLLHIPTWSVAKLSGTHQISFWDLFPLWSFGFL